MAYRWNGFECDTIEELTRLRDLYRPRSQEKRVRRFDINDDHEDRCPRYPRRRQRCVLETGHDGLCDL